MNEKLKVKYQELYQKHGVIRIRAKGADELPLDAIFEFQGGLKKLRQENAIKLATSIFAKGFIAPFHIWKHDSDAMCLDGHQRLTVLCGIREAGIPIPGLFPVDYIQAKDKQEAREMLLAITSQYGEFETEQIGEWLKNTDKEIVESLRLVDKEIELVKIDDEDLEEAKQKEQSINLEPYKKIHVLLSMAPDTFFDIQELLKKIKQFDGVEYEQSKN